MKNFYSRRKKILYKFEILATVELAHYFRSAFTPYQVWRLLLIKLEYDKFIRTICELVNEKKLREKNGHLYRKNYLEQSEAKKSYSRTIFINNKFYLRILSKLPFIKYIGLTGANAFESCTENDDIDLFVVTDKNRLWVSYILIVLFSKLLGKRNIFCVNYLVDENNLTIKHQNYYTAVQLMHMIPLFDGEMNIKLVKSNEWICNYLPNADDRLPVNPFYLIKAESRNGKSSDNLNIDEKDILTLLNRFIYRKYSARLKRNFPQAFGKGIILTEGIAKLNRHDYQDIYQKIYKEIKEVLVL